jgi:hypothetical protein
VIKLLAFGADQYLTSIMAATVGACTGAESDAKSEASPRHRFISSSFKSHAAGEGEEHWRGGTLSKDEEWVSAIRDRSKIYKRLEMSFDVSSAACTHAGFIQYLHACWAAERGVVLRRCDLAHCFVRNGTHNSRQPR